MTDKFDIDHVWDAIEVVMTIITIIAVFIVLFWFPI